MFRPLAAALLFLFAPSLFAQTTLQNPSIPPKKDAGKQSASKQLSPSDELQQTIESAGNDRAALVRNLENYLKKYPQAPERPQIFRALVEACLQLRDTSRAAAYTERLVSLTPEDMSITLLAIQLLEKNGDEAALKRAVNYSSRVIEYIHNSSTDEKSPRVSPEEWATEKKRDESSLLLLRGRLESKLHDSASARKDFEASYALVPNSSAAEKLGELDELEKSYNAAIKQYARAFSLTDLSSKNDARRELRQKLGNVWRLAHGSDAGLGDFLLATFDELANNATPKPKRNAAAKEPFDFMLRTAPAGADYPLSAQKGKIVVVNFWATWCGPCRALEPFFEKAAAEFSGNENVLFLAADCDDDETLVAPYLDEVKPRTTVVFADGLENLFRVEAFPTVIVLDRAGRVSYRTDGFGDSGFVTELSSAIHRALAPATESEKAAPSAQ
ncbi:MAG TPA: TlpA disulfide reductase family protein [Candidatus Dormibacteraeota bacterium]|jgi:thiol-disulfide isomerase/thioredoxin|nr:TlpA disulfide reductase family protein [Candidatus Dormibacteraeota bacterium]